ncbi:MAG: hypothetical protein LBE39_14950 [Flavobacteriaceae bacterium]|nr:hypothetical protein [Flavobacteriaceae bacterium]
MQKVVLLFFVLFSCLGMAQDKKEIDSLLGNIAKLEKPDSKVRTNTSKVDVILKMSTEAYYQAKEIDYTEGRARALIFIIKNYIHIGDFKAALERINEGISFTQGEESTQKYRVSFFVLKGSVLSQLGYSDEAKINFNNAAEIIEMVPEFSADAEHYKKILKHASFILSYEQEKAQPLGNKKENEQYLQEAYKEVGQIKNNSTLKTVLYVHILRSLVSYYTESNELDRAEYYIAEGDKLYSDYPGWLIKRNFLLGAIEKKRQNYTKAIEAYNMALQIAEQYQFKYAEKQIYNWISECYHELKDYKNESLYLDKSKKLSDSLNLSEKATTGDVLKHETKNKSEETSFWKSSALYYLIAVLFIIIVIVIILKQKSIRSNTADHIAEKVPEHEEEQLDHEALNLLIGLAEKDDPSFYFKFNEAFPNFSDNLLKISPKLTQSDIEYCAMMKLNFDTKKIASIKRLSIGAVESKKYRIRKKLDISTEENIYIWLMDK